MAQQLVDCQFCDTSRNRRGGVRWKCLNCDLTLCENCKTGKHSRIKDSNQHRILDIQTLGTIHTIDWIREVDLQKIVCIEHANRKCYHFCKECKKAICPSCILEHCGHNLIELEIIYKDQQQRLKNMHREIEEDLQTLPGIIAMISKEEEEISRNYDDVRQKIEQRESEIKVQATHDAKRLLKDLEDFRKNENTVLSMKQQKVREYEQSLKHQKNEIQETFKSHKAMSILTTIGQIDKKIALENNVHGPKQKFVFKTPSSHCIDFGSLIKLPELYIKRKYQIEDINVSGIKGKHGNNTIMVFKKNKLGVYFLGNVSFSDSKCIISNEKEISDDVFDLTITKDGIILFSMDQSSEIKCITKNSEIETFSSIESKKVRGIHACDSGNIFVGFSGFHDGEQGGLLVLNEEKTHIKTFELNKNNEHIFSFPNKITTNKNGDICVIDHRFYVRTVVALNEEGHVQWTYNAHEMEPFNPYDIVTTSTGYIELADNILVEIESSSMDILIGNYYYLDLILLQRIEIQPELYLLASKLGWIITGRAKDTSDCKDETGLLILSHVISDVVSEKTNIMPRECGFISHQI
ncbi:uncharacterized protein LOC127721229 [Mytilus californianus]|uniref:uncharacterized protein LOC127721229 n=1 Tax=Mytilus californianus TaxID=6549 RepID=UPI00224690A3|nr:uncharacterized protein LOC127721229 [Mytilus californianus]